MSATTHGGTEMDKPTWSDATSYSRFEAKVPRSWVLKLKMLKISVFTGHIHYPAGVWLLDCRELDIEKHELLAKDAGVAQAEGLIYVRERIGEMYREIESVRL